MYYLLLHAFLPLAPGEGVRLLSALFGSLSLVLAWLVLRAELDRNEALAALALFALSPFEILYAQQARPYTLRVALALAALLLARKAARTGRHRDWAMMAGAAGLAALSHFLSLAWLPALAVRAGLETRSPRNGWIRPAGWACVAAAPAVTLALIRRGAIATAVASAHGPLDPLEFLNGLVLLFGAGAWVPAVLARPAWLAFAALGGAGLVVAVLRFRRRPPEPINASILALGLVPPVLLVAANWLGIVQSAKIRFAIEAHLFLLAACVRGAALAPSRVVRRGLVAGLLAVELAAVGSYARGGFPALDLPPCLKPFREAAALIRERMKPGDAVAGYEYETYMPLKMLLSGQALSGQTNPGSRPVEGTELPMSYLLRDPLAPDSELDWVGRPVTVAQAATARTRLWLVVAPVHYSDPLDVPGELTRSLVRIGRLELDTSVPGIRIQCWRLKR